MNRFAWLLALPLLIQNSTAPFRNGNSNDVDLRIDVKGKQKGDLYCIEQKEPIFISCSEHIGAEPYCIYVRSMCIRTKWDNK